jgi:aconitase A
MSDSFSTRSQLNVGGKTYDYFSLPTLGQRFDISHLPYSMKILLENLLRHEDGGVTVGKDHIEAVARWNPAAEPDTEIAFMPARVVLQDFTGVPCGRPGAMRDAVVKLGGRINRRFPPNWSSTTRCRSTCSASPTRWTSTARSNSSATRNATASCAGAEPSTTSRWCRRTPASSTR